MITFTICKNNLVYNFKYEIINNPLTDNKVIFKILTNDELKNESIDLTEKEFKKFIHNIYPTLKNGMKTMMI